MAKTNWARESRLMPNGTPRYIRCYDDGGKSIDRYTVVYSGRYRRRDKSGRFDTGFQYVAMNAAPFHPQGFGQHGESDNLIDRPTSGHLGKKIAFDKLPDDCKRLVLQDYRSIWNLERGHV